MTDLVFFPRTSDTPDKRCEALLDGGARGHFRCGQPARYQVGIAGTVRRYVCAEHVPVAQKLFGDRAVVVDVTTGKVVDPEG